jgi:hypothetical protein
VPRQPGPQVGIAAGDTQPGAEPAHDDPSTRWPAPNPRAAREPSTPGRQDAHVVAASRATRPPERAGITAQAEADGTTPAGGPTDPPDWRDRLLADARGHGSPPRGSPATRPHPYRPNARHHARVSSQTHDLDDLHHLMKDGRMRD